VIFSFKGVKKMSLRKMFSLISILTLVTACGGGGGGSGGTSDPASPLPVNEQSITTVSMSVSEGILQLGQMLKDNIDIVDMASIYPISNSCSNGGTYDIDFSDNDQSSNLSANDTLRVDYRDCFQQSVNGVLSGSAEITISNYSNLDEDKLFSALSDLSGITINSSGTEIELSGSLNLSASNSLLNSSITVTPTNSRFAIILSIDNEDYSEIVEDFTLTKLLSFDEASYEININATIQSSSIGKRISVNTPDPIIGFFSTFPDSGEMNLNTDDFSISITPNFVTNSRSFNLSTNGAVPTRYFWTNFIEGYLWWNPLQSQRYEVNSLNINNFNILYTLQNGLNSIGQTLPVNVSFKVQASRVINSVELNSFTSNADNLFLEPRFGSSLPDIPVTIEQFGAVLILTPQSQLEHNTNYFFSHSIILQDEFENERSINLSSFTTDNNLISNPSSNKLVVRQGETVILDGESSVSTNSNITNYSWTQISGDTVELSSINGSQTSFIVPNISTSQNLVFELRVTDENSEYSTNEITIGAFETSDNPSIVYINGEDDNNQNQELFLTNLSGNFNVSRRTNFLEDNITVSANNNQATSTFGTISFAAPNNTPLTVGSYQNAIRFPNQGATQPTISVRSSIGNDCFDLTGNFEVFEIQYDPDGNIEVLSIDFEQSCDSSTQTGSIRYNTSNYNVTNNP
jgi:hypothetical protein